MGAAIHVHAERSPAACRTSLLSLVEASWDCGQGHRQEATGITLRPLNFNFFLGEDPQTSLGADVMSMSNTLATLTPPLKHS